jgi:spore coat polysaccharide biosynthesis protein SpsF
MVDASVRRHARGDADYVYCVLDRVSFPIGFDAQVYARALLEEVDRLATSDEDRTNVTPYVYHHPERYRLLNLYAPPELDRPDYFLCVDELRDLVLVRKIFEALAGGSGVFGVRDIIGYLDAHPELPASNRRERAELEYPRSGGLAAQEEMRI